MKRINLLTALKIVSVCYIVFATSCTTPYGYQTSNRPFNEIMFEDLAWDPDPENLVASVDLPELRNVSEGDIISVKVKVRGYEFKVSANRKVLGAEGRYYWYEFTPNNIKLLCTITQGENLLPPTVTVTLR